IKLTARGERGQKCWVLLVLHFHVRTLIMNWHRWGRSNEKNRPIHACVVDSPLGVLCDAISSHWIFAVTGFIRIVLRPCSAFSEAITRFVAGPDKSSAWITVRLAIYHSRHFTLDPLE